MSENYGKGLMLDCEHGSLKRSCLICELQDNLKAATSEIERLKTENNFCLKTIEKDNVALATSIEMITALQEAGERYRIDFRNIMNELGVPQPDYPAPVSNAYKIAEEALSSEAGESKGEGGKQ